MKPSMILFLFAIATLAGCKKLDIEKDTPRCIRQEIKDFDQSSTCENADVSAYTFQGKTVYTFSPGNCGADMQTDVLDEECNLLGSLGGIMGTTQIKGESFSHAVFLKNIWTKG